jgi:hypothetical protein
MQCKACGSHNQAEFSAEINVHFPGLKNLDKPAVLVFPKLLLCRDCGFSEFTLRESELLLLDETRLSGKDPSNEGVTDAPKDWFHLVPS